MPINNRNCLITIAILFQPDPGMRFAHSSAIESAWCWSTMFDHLRKKVLYMIYLECIRVQTAESYRTPGKDDPWSLVQQELDNLEFGQGDIFFRMDQPGEAMVMLRWDRDDFDSRGSRVAQLLVSELRKLGLVNFSVWATGLKDGRNL